MRSPWLQHLAKMRYWRRGDARGRNRHVVGIKIFSDGATLDALESAADFKNTGRDHRRGRDASQGVLESSVGIIAALDGAAAVQPLG